LSAGHQKPKQWKLIDLLNWTAEYLATKGFENGRLETELLLAHSLSLRRIDLYVNFDRPLVVDELAHFKSLLKRRLENEPLQYIMGETEFYSLPFKVAPGVLIPRPETEILVDNIIRICLENFEETAQVNILDVGSGSGNIAVACAKNIPSARLTSVDISEAALDIAKNNAEINGVKDDIKFIKLDALKEWPENYHQSFNIIVSNPPYVSTAEYINLAMEIKDYEPQNALVSGEFGLDFYRKFSLQLKDLSRKNTFILFEIGEKQAKGVIECYKNVGFLNAIIVKDLSNKDRVIIMNDTGARK
jgi:release factor glutamine methyltransferase